MPVGASARTGSGPSMAQLGYPTQRSGPVASIVTSPTWNRYRPPVRRSLNGAAVGAADGELRAADASGAGVAGTDVAVVGDRAAPTLDPPGPAAAHAAATTAQRPIPTGTSLFIPSSPLHPCVLARLPRVTSSFVRDVAPRQGD